MKCDLSNIAIGVRDLDRAVAFYRDVMGLTLGRTDPSFRYAQFDLGKVSLRLVGEEGQDVQRERNFAIGLAVPDVEAAYEELKAKGADFKMPPTHQPWGAVMARLADPEGNIIYLMKE